MVLSFESLRSGFGKDSFPGTGCVCETFFQKIRSGFRHGGDVARKRDSLGIDRKGIVMFQHNQAAPRFQSQTPEPQMRSRKIRSVNGQHIGRRIVFQPEFDLRKIASEIGPGKIRLTLPNSGGDLNRRRPARSEQSVPMRVDLLLDDCLLGNPGEQNFVKRPDFQRRESHSRIERPVARQIKKIVFLPHRNPHQPGGGKKFGKTVPAPGTGKRSDSSPGLEIPPA